MTIRKGEANATRLRREYPFAIAVPLPAGGLGRWLDALTVLARSVGGRCITTTAHIAGREYVEFRFRTEAEADQFRTGAGGMDP